MPTLALHEGDVVYSKTRLNHVTFGKIYTTVHKFGTQIYLHYQQNITDKL